MRTMILTSDPNGVIGKDGKLPWPMLKCDSDRFEKITVGHTVVMGRNTFNSLLQQPLKGRCNIVLTKKITFSDLFKAVKFNLLNLRTSLKFVKDKEYVLENYTYEPVYIIGGKEMFRLFEDCCDGVWWTKIYKEYEGDVIFKPSQILWRVSSRHQYEGYEIVYLTKKY